MTDSAAWLVRAGNGNELYDDFEQKGIVAIGWSGIGDLKDLNSRSDVKSAYEEQYPDHSKHRRATNAGQLYRFAHEMKVGDHVLTYNKTDREYLVGEITSEYVYDPERVSYDYSHIRSVNWQHQESRDAFSTPVKNTLGSTLTVFSVTERWDAINSVLTGEDTETETEVEESGPAYIEDVESQADELISDILANMDPFDFEELVAAILRAMGYEATKTRDSHDHGVDVVAHPDAFGFEEPFLKVQVKRQKGTVGGPTMREFTGTLNRGEKGLYVATGGYTTSARRAARESAQRVTFVDRDEFIDLLIDHYGEIEPEYQALVPLRPVYIPTRDPPTRS